MDPKESAVYKMYFIQTRFVKNWGRDLDGFRIEFGKFGEELGKTAEEGRVQSFQFYTRNCRRGIAAPPCIIIRRDKVVRYISGDSYFVKHVACSPYL